MTSLYIEGSLSLDHSIIQQIGEIVLKHKVLVQMKKTDTGLEIVVVLDSVLVKWIIIEITDAIWC